MYKTIIQAVEAINKKSLLIFDFDGTIASTSSLHSQAFNEVLMDYNLIVDYKKIAGLKTIDAFKKCLTDENIEIDNKELENLCIKKQEFVRDLLNNKNSIKPLPGVDSFLNWSKNRFELSIASSASKGTLTKAIEILGYKNIFNFILSSEDVENSKPAPDLFLKSLSISNKSEDQSIVFEDSNVGIESARAANINYIDVRKFNFMELINYILNNEK